MGVTNFDEIAVVHKGKAASTHTLVVAGTESTGTAKATAYIAKGGKIVAVKGYLGTPATGATTFKVDVNIGGVTAFTTQANRPTWVASANLSSATLPDITTVPDDSILTIDIDAIGSTIAGSDLTVAITIARPLVD